MDSSTPGTAAVGSLTQVDTRVVIHVDNKATQASGNPVANARNPRSFSRPVQTPEITIRTIPAIQPINATGTTIARTSATTSATTAPISTGPSSGEPLIAVPSGGRVVGTGGLAAAVTSAGASSRTRIVRTSASVGWAPRPSWRCEVMSVISSSAWSGGSTRASAASRER
jgi:hypothetical protein